MPHSASSRRYGQQSRFIEGSFIYDQADWYVQDNWKVSIAKLTLDYGLRLVHQATAVRPVPIGVDLLPGRVEPGERAVPLRAGMRRRQPVHRQQPSGAWIRARDRCWARARPRSSAATVGSGNVANGMTQAGDGIAKSGFVWPELALARRGSASRTT